MKIITILVRLTFHSVVGAGFKEKSKNEVVI